jgi:hypothetical protein
MIVKKCNYCGMAIQNKQQDVRFYPLPEDNWNLSLTANIYNGSISEYGLIQYQFHKGCYNKIKRIIDSLMSIKELKR